MLSSIKFEIIIGNQKDYLIAEEILAIEEVSNRLGKTFSEIVLLYEDIKRKHKLELLRIERDEMPKISDYTSYVSTDYDERNYLKHQNKIRNNYYNKHMACKFKHGNYKGKK